MDKEHTLRVAVVDASGRALSSVWRLWTRNEEFYVSVRALASHFKTSLHSGGNHRHAFVSQEIADAHRDPGLDRAVYKWRHSGGSKPGPSLFYQIAIPEVGLGTTSSASVPENVKTLPSPNDGEMAILSVISDAAGSAMGTDSFTGSVQVLDSWKTPDGLRFTVTSHVDRVTSADMATWRAFVLEHPIFDPNNIESADERGTFDPRTFILMDAGVDGIGRVVDLGIREMAAWARR